jgi:hypothetical protein
MDLRVAATGNEVTVPAGTTAVIGADTSATVRVARPGISRRHAVVKYDGSHWVLQDASSRNGTFHNGARIQFLDVKGPTTVRLGHPVEGAEVHLTPTASAPTKPAASSPAPAASAPPASKSEPAPPQNSAPAKATAPASAPVQRTRVTPATAANSGGTDPQLDDLIATLNDTAKSMRGLTWSVWAMIAVTAVLAILTLFVGVIGN